MKVVSNTSPIIFLRHLGCLDLFSSCFGKVFIPKAVAAELGTEQLPLTIEILQISAEGQSFVERHHGALHRGELEAMQLARETNADLVLLDDLLARTTKQNHCILMSWGHWVFFCLPAAGDIFIPNWPRRKSLR